MKLNNIRVHYPGGGSVFWQVGGFLLDGGKKPKPVEPKVWVTKILYSPFFNEVEVRFSNKERAFYAGKIAVGYEKLPKIITRVLKALETNQKENENKKKAGDEGATPPTSSGDL